jgi:hypothetical protein
MTGDTDMTNAIYNYDGDNATLRSAFAHARYNYLLDRAKYSMDNGLYFQSESRERWDNALLQALANWQAAEAAYHNSHV